MRPVDLYCYLYARFGPPNGIQNFLRKDDSDNLVHWEWTLAYEFGWLSIQGMSFRTAILVHGLPIDESDIEMFTQLLKADFAKYGKRMSEIRNSLLEKWIEFVNPYYRLRNAVTNLLAEIASLKLEPEKDSHLNVVDMLDQREEGERRWLDAAARYSKGLGMCFGIRSMLPILAEAFINLLLFVFMKGDLKRDGRLQRKYYTATHRHSN